LVTKFQILPKSRSGLHAHLLQDKPVSPAGALLFLRYALLKSLGVILSAAKNLAPSSNKEIYRGFSTKHLRL
jgi:hypothetical protein